VCVRVCVYVCVHVCVCVCVLEGGDVRSKAARRCYGYCGMCAGALRTCAGRAGLEEARSVQQEEEFLPHYAHVRHCSLSCTETPGAHRA